MNIIETIQSEKIFLHLFRDLRTWNNWIVFLKAVFGLPIESRTDRRLFRKCTGLKKPPSSKTKEAFCIVGRRGGKSFISSIMSVYLACFKNWKPFLSPGERGYIFIVAVDKKQAAIIKGYISAILHSSRMFEQMIERETKEQIDLNNDVSIMIKTCNFRTVRGYTILCAILEELAFWRDENSANPDKEILNAIRPALGTVKDSMLLGISTPYSRSGVLWEQFKSGFGKGKDAPLIWKANTMTMNPTIDKKIVENALREDHSAARSEWLGEFRTDLESFLSVDLIEQAVIPNRQELPPVESHVYYGFCDPSGGRGDSMTLAISHRNSNTGKIVLDLMRESRPPFQPQSVVKEFSETLKRYGITQLEADSYAGEWVSNSFRDNGIMIQNSEHSASEIYLNVLPLFSNGYIELLDNTRLVGQLKSLERKTRRGGRDQVSHPPGGHDDLSNSVCGSILRTQKEGEFIRDEWQRGEFYENVPIEDKLAAESVDWLLGRKPEKTKDPIDEHFDVMGMSDEELQREIEKIEKKKRENKYHFAIKKW